MGELDKKELEHLSMIQEKLQGEVIILEQSLEAKEKEIIDMKKDYWESLNDVHELQYESIFARGTIESATSTANERLAKLTMYKKMIDSPYFGRIDFIYDGEEEAESYYIGIGSFYPKWATSPLIFDWRAPISGLFYDFDKGRASFLAPVGKIEGEIVHKIQYKIEEGKLLYYFENDMKIDDDILKTELGMNANAQLKSIVSTIQKEQNEIIRNEKDRILVVQGAAGSGKTSIALHRIAYLLYHKRKDFTAKDILILSPNAVFSDYISHILPELGEENIVEMSFDDFAEKELKGTARFESRYSSIDSLLAMEEGTLRREKRVKREQRKQSKEFILGMEKFVSKIDSWLVKYKDVSFKQITRSADEIKILFTKKFNKVPLLKRLEQVYEFIVEEEATLKGEDLDIIVMETLKSKILGLYSTTDLLKIYNRYLDHRGEAAIDVESRHLDYEDVYPVLYLKYLLYGRLEYRQIKHLVVDEMQDYSYLQYVLLKKLFPCPMTILGDREQVAADEASSILDYLPEIYGEEVKCVILNKSYRSTYEIGTFAGKLIAQEGIEYVERHGKEPEIVTVIDKKAQLIELKKRLDSCKNYATMAIICKTRKEVEELYDKLKDSYEVTPILDGTEEFKQGIVILPFYLAKGLEFDAVHIVNLKNKDFDSSLMKQVLYIACTRALHELYLYVQ